MVIFFLNRFAPSSFGLATAVSEYSKSVEGAAVSARQVDARMCDRSGLVPLGLWQAIRDDRQIWHIDDLFAPYCAVAALIGLLLGRKVVICPHGMLDRWALRTRRYRMKRTILAVLNRAARGRHLMLHLLNEKEARIAAVLLPEARMARVVPNGVPSDILEARDALLAAREPYQRRVIGCLSRISPKKNQREIVAIAELLREEQPEAFAGIEFRIDGQVEDEAYSKLLRGDIAAAGLTEHVILGGDVPYDARGAVVAQYDLFLFPSRSEGMPYVVLEALALGVPPLVSQNAMCDFVTAYGGHVYDGASEAAGAVSRKMQVDIDGVLSAFGPSRFDAFLREVEAVPNAA